MEDKLRINQRIQLSILEEGNKGNYYSRVEDLLDDETIVVAAPLKNRFLVPVKVGEKINIFFWDNESQYAFVARVIDDVATGVPTITIKKCSAMKRMQRRSYFRIQAMLRVVFSIEGGDEGAERHDYEGWTLNISGGGVLLSTRARLKTGDQLNMELYLSEHDYVTTVGGVERIDYLNAKRMYRSGIVFSAISESERDRIVAFVFEKEIELRRRGLL